MRIAGREIHMSPFQTISVSVLAAILAGTFLLMLPFSSRIPGSTNFGDALFTATSAVCVTGLVVFDTARHWSLFGQIVILALIQVGGMGVMTFAVAAALFSGHRIALLRLQTLQESIALHSMGSVPRLAAFILKAGIAIECVGAVLMAPVFIRDFGMLPGLWRALFHSVSAFCNAGFDLMGADAPFSSLTAYALNPLVNVAVMLLIIIGGIGFLSWDDVRSHGRHLRLYSLQSKVILMMTAALIFFPALFFYFHEFSGSGQFWLSLFQAVTPRTAGFNSVDLNVMSDLGQSVIIMLMLIGGAPGSAAGGMKVTTVCVLFTSAFAVFRRRQNVQFMGRRIPADSIAFASAIFLMYIVLFFLAGLAMSGLESLPLKACLFEAASAIGTVGLTLGITVSLGTASRLILIALMFLGRVGGLTLIFAATASPVAGSAPKFPEEKITIG